MIKHILFDFDGTIADSSGLLLQVLHELAERKHINHLSAEELFRFMGLPIHRRLKPLGVRFFKLPRLMAEGLRIYSQRTQGLRMFDGLDSVLRGLHEEGFRLSIISSNSVENIQRFLREHELECFEQVISAKLFGKHRALQKYLKACGLAPEEALYVGDEYRDIEACQKVSVQIVSVTWGYDSLELLKSGNPDFIAYQPSDIRGVIEFLKAE